MLENLAPETIHMKLNNITSRELEMIRPFLIDSMNLKLDILNVNNVEQIHINNMFESKLMK
jgi:hypothetical protein